MRRVAVTGIGVVSSVGIGRDAFFDNLLAPQVAGERRIADWDPSPYFDGPKEVRHADRVTQFAIAAASEALEQAGSLASAPERCGVLIGTGIGGLHTTEQQVQVYHEKGPRRVSPFFVPMMMPNAAAAQVSMRFGLQGPCESVATACATGTHAIGSAARWIRWGQCDAALAGGTEACLTPVGVQGFANMKALSDDLISRPFDAARNGFVPAEGAAVLVLEAEEVARERGAEILGYALGSASTADAHHITAPLPGGGGAIRCIELALADSGITPQDIRQVNAHGTGTALNDAAEAEAIAKVFGLPGPAVTSIKGVTGHALGAAGALEAAAVLLSMERGVIPPTDGLQEPDPALPAIDLVREARRWEPGPTISNSFGFGGHNGTLVLGQP